MKMKSVLSSAVLLALVAFSGCEYSRQATFTFTGTVSSQNGGPVVLGVDSSIDLCADVTYNELSKGKFVMAHTQTICRDLITDQMGNYSLGSPDKLRTTAKSSDSIEIKNFKVYGRKSVTGQSSTTYYIMPAKITDIKILADGAALKADVTVMDY